MLKRFSKNIRRRISNIFCIDDFEFFLGDLREEYIKRKKEQSFIKASAWMLSQFCRSIGSLVIAWIISKELIRAMTILFAACAALYLWSFLAQFAVARIYPLPISSTENGSILQWAMLSIEVLGITLGGAIIGLLTQAYGMRLNANRLALVLIILLLSSGVYFTIQYPYGVPTILRVVWFVLVAPAIWTGLALADYIRMKMS